MFSPIQEDYYQAEKTIKKIEQITKFEKKIKDASKSIKGDEEMYRVRRLAEKYKKNFGICQRYCRNCVKYEYRKNFDKNGVIWENGQSDSNYI